MPTDPSRLDALEMRIAHQDAVIEELNAAVTAQWGVIDRLTRELAKLAERQNSDMASVEQANPLRAGEEAPPPHW